MVDGEDLKRKRGTATVLALLVSFLFGYAPAQAQSQADRSARLGPAEIVKRAVPLRATARSEADDTDSEEALLPPPPRIVTERSAVRPAGDTPRAIGCNPSRPTPLAYRARAPPAA